MDEKLQRSMKIFTIEADDVERLLQRLKDFAFKEKYLSDEIGDETNHLFRTLSFLIFGNDHSSALELLHTVVCKELRDSRQRYQHLVDGDFLAFWTSIKNMEKFSRNHNKLVFMATCEAFRVRALVIGVDEGTCMKLYTPRCEASRKFIYICETSKLMFPMCPMRDEWSTIYPDVMEQIGTLSSSDDLLKMCSEFFPDKILLDPANAIEQLDHRLSLFGCTKLLVSSSHMHFISSSERGVNYKLSVFESLGQQLSEEPQIVQLTAAPQLSKHRPIYNARLSENEAEDYDTFCVNVTTKEPIPRDILLQAIADAYRVRILEIVTEDDVLMKETLPFYGVYKKVLIVCSTNSHMYPVSFDVQ